MSEAPKRWHVVSDWDTIRHFDWAKDHERPGDDEPVWTLSLDPKHTGWETDSGCHGYGLTYAEAKELADAANEAALKKAGRA